LFEWPYYQGKIIMDLAREYSRLSLAPATTCETRRQSVFAGVLHVVAGANERRLYSQAIMDYICWDFRMWSLDEMVIFTRLSYKKNIDTIELDQGERIVKINQSDRFIAGPIFS